MTSVLLVLRAVIFQNIGVRKQVVRSFYRERLGVHLGIVESDLHIQVTEIAPPEAFCHVQGLAVRMAESIQPAFVIEPHGVDDQSVAFPFTYRISQP